MVSNEKKNRLPHWGWGPLALLTLASPGLWHWCKQPVCGQCWGPLALPTPAAWLRAAAGSIADGKTLSAQGGVALPFHTQEGLTYLHVATGFLQLPLLGWFMMWWWFMLRPDVLLIPDFPLPICEFTVVYVLSAVVNESAQTYQFFLTSPSILWSLQSSPMLYICFYCTPVNSVPTSSSF